MSLELSALYQIHRYQIILNSKDFKGDYQLPIAYLYAVALGIFPYFHQSWCCGKDPYEDCYTLKKDFISEVIEYVDNLWITSQPIPTFYDLERKYGKESRFELVAIFRYCYLNKGFDEKFYQALLQESPVEANFCMEFSEDELLLI